MIEKGETIGSEKMDSDSVLSKLFDKRDKTENKEVIIDKEDSSEGDNKDNKQDLEDLDEISFKPFMSSLIEKEILDELPEDFEDNEDGFALAIQNTVEKKVEEKFQERLSGLSERTIKLIEIEENGGDISDIIQNSLVDYNSIDLEDEDNQQMIIEELYELKGLDSEEIEEIITKYRDTGKLEAKALEAQKVLSKQQVDREEELIARQEQEIAIKQESERKAFDEKIKETKKIVSDFEEIDGITLNKQKREQLLDYIYKPMYKDENGNLYSQWQFETLDEQEKIKDAFRRMENRNILSATENKGKTKASEELYKELSKNKAKSTTINRDRDFDQTISKIPKQERKMFGE